MSSHYPTLAAYNSGVLRARADYRARPSRACHREHCDNLAEGMLCDVHVGGNDESAARMKAKRGAA